MILKFMHRRLQFPVTRHVLAAALFALLQDMVGIPDEPDPIVLGGYL